MATEKALKDLNQEVYKVDPDYKENGNKIKYTESLILSGGKEIFLLTTLKK